MSTRYPLARRTAQIDPFHVMELTKRAAALEAAGHPVIHLNIGEPDFTAPEPVVAALERAVRAGHTRYTAATGLAPLREAIARDYGERYGLDIAPSRIVVTAGASAALSLACCALVDPGASVLMTDPGYPCNRHFVTAFDGAPQLVAVGPETRFQLTRAMVQAHWHAGTRGALIASPANPTGTSIRSTSSAESSTPCAGAAASRSSTRSTSACRTTARRARRSPGAKTWSSPTASRSIST